ncbi:MAG: altronate dehydratase [Ramlibacter sp.]|nr:altronate dehydratase [Ramlibacter sp.]
MTNGESLALRLHPDDNVAIARHALPGGSVLSEYAGMVVGADIPAAHKVAISDIRQSEPVRRYGQIIGFATQPIRRGEHVHMHNLAMGAFERDYAFGADARQPSLTTLASFTFSV